MNNNSSILAPVESAKKLIQKALLNRTTQKKLFFQIKAAFALATKRGFKHSKELFSAYIEGQSDNKINRLTKRLLSYISIDEMMSFAR